MSLVFIRSVGGLLTSEFLDELAKPAPKDSPFAPATFELRSEEEFLVAVAGAFDELRNRFRSVREELKGGSLNNGELRKRWLLPLFRALDFEPQYQKTHLRLGDRSFAISHTGWPENTPAPPPLHMVGTPLDQKPQQRGAKSPHALLQTYLNHPHSPDWGIVTNGRMLRLLSQNFHPRPAFVEVDLLGLFDAGRELALSEFRVLYRLIHRSRFYGALEQYRKRAQEVGTRNAAALREGAREAIVALGNAFLNPQLKRDLQNKQSLDSYYQELLIFIYRLIFLLYAESRGLIPGPAPLGERYLEELSILALRELSESDAALEDRGEDLFERLLLVFELVQRGDEQLGIPALGGELFGADRLGMLTGGLRLPEDRARQWNRLPHLQNGDLLRALRHLTHADIFRINYRDLGVEELGYIYEGLLGLVPSFDGEEFNLVDDPSGRKASGSYYTPKELVGAVIEESLEPLIAERLAGRETAEEKEAALLGIRVLDPAMGSGAFLTGALERLAEELARIWTESGRYESLAEALPEARHRVAERCLYGVDLNPMAVELAKLSIWIASAARGRPLSFLDHHLKVGNSLVGAPPNFYALGVPKEAYTKRGIKGEAIENLKLLTGRTLERWRRGQSGSPLFDFAAALPELPETQATAEDVEAAHRAYAAWQESEPVEKWRLIADYWTAAWFAEPAPGRRLPDHEGLDWLVNQAARAGLAQLEASSYLPPPTVGEIKAKARRHRFFHWWLEFPEVFLDKNGRFKEHGGFDAVLGNPPWERVKLEDKQFFAGRDEDVFKARNKAAREELIAALEQANPTLFHEYQKAKREAEATSNFLHTSGRYPLTGRGDVNTYSVFAEHARDVLGWGRAGLILPSGIATDDTNKHFFADVVAKGELAALLDFENREAVFPSIHRSYKFSIFALRKPGRPEAPARLLFFATRVEHLEDEERAFSLTTEEFALLNPNTRTCPTFRTRADAELTKAIYRRVPVLWREKREDQPEENPWGIRFLRMFDMANDAYLFKTRGELEAEGLELQGNRFVRGSKTYLPLYEAKMIWQFDHRFATYDPGADRTRDTTPEEHASPTYQPLPRYWVTRDDVEERLTKRDREGNVVWKWEREWLLGFRDITNATNERTAIFSLLPRAGVGHTLPLLFSEESVLRQQGLVVNMNSIALDFVARQKVGGTHLTYNYLTQFPVLPPSAYAPDHLAFILPRALELLYTAWDLAPLARDVWAELQNSGSAALPPEVARAIREEIARRFAEHHGVDLEEAKRDPRFSPPAWHSGPYPFPPFGWNEDRRARVRAELDAYYARLYGLNRKQLRYVLDPADLTEREIETLVENDWEEVADPLNEAAYQARTRASTHPSVTFAALKRKEIREYGEYRTRRLVLEAWQRLFGLG